MPAGNPPFWMHDLGLHGAGALLAALAVVWLVLAEPVLGRRAFRGFLRALERGERDARVRFYRLWIVQSWVLTALLVLIALYVFKWPPAALGWRAPRIDLHASLAPLVGFVTALLAGTLFGVVLARRRRNRPLSTRHRESPRRRAMRDLLRMLPYTASERGWFAVLAITAGITEEVVWRGVLLAILLVFLPGLPMFAYVLVLAVVFGWAHLYQGGRGMLGAGIMGGVLAAMYLATGSLLLPIVVHALIDLAAMLQAPRTPAGTASGPTGA